MGYISAEEFLKQSKEIQDVFLEWWQPSFGDFLQYKYLFCIVDYRCGEAIKLFNENYTIFKKECIPLLTESQIRKFVGDKTVCKMNVGNISKVMDIYRKELDIPYETDLLQAYWKVAIEIAKECF